MMTMTARTSGALEHFSSIHYVRNETITWNDKIQSLMYNMSSYTAVNFLFSIGTSTRCVVPSATPQIELVEIMTKWMILVNLLLFFKVGFSLALFKLNVPNSSEEARRSVKHCNACVPSPKFVYMQNIPKSIERRPCTPNLWEHVWIA